MSWRHPHAQSRGVSDVTENGSPGLPHVAESNIEYLPNRGHKPVVDGHPAGGMLNQGQFRLLKILP